MIRVAGDPLIAWLDATLRPLTEPDTPALRALEGTDLAFEPSRTQRARSAEESADLPGHRARSAPADDRRPPGRRRLRLRARPGRPADRLAEAPAHLGVSRLSLPDADEAKAATGYERGAITPFGSTRAWPVIADATIPPPDRVAIGGGGTASTCTSPAPTSSRLLGAEVADVTKPGDPAGRGPRRRDVEPGAATFVIVHGACGGGWEWRDVAAVLRRGPYEVHTPTLTDFGERAHLLSPEVGLATHVKGMSSTSCGSRISTTWSTSFLSAAWS